MRMNRRALLRLMTGARICLALAMSLACRKPSAVVAPPAALALEISGCAEVVRAAESETSGVNSASDSSTRGPVTPRKTNCVLAANRELRVVVPAGEGAVDWLVDGTKLTVPTPTPVVDGARYTLRIPAEVSAVMARRLLASGQVAAESTVTFVPSAQPTWVERAQAERQQGNLDAAAALATAALSATATTERAAARGLLARIALRRGAVDLAVEHFRAALQLDEQSGMVSWRVDDAFALVFLLHQRAPRYAEARTVLQEVEPWLDGYADGRARAPLYRAQVAWESGNVRAAVRDLDLAVLQAERLGATAIARAARQVRSMVACSSGSIHACVGALRENDIELNRVADAPACERAELVISLGFAELEAAELDGVIPPNLGESDERGLALLNSSCPDPYMRVVAHEHLAMAAVLKHNPTLAESQFQLATQSTKQPRMVDAVTWLDIEGHIAELRGRPEVAAAAYDKASTLAHNAALRTQEVRALVGKGRALTRVGESKRLVHNANTLALDAFVRAEAVLDEAVEMVPFGDGRASAAADGGESVRRAVPLMLAQGKTDAAIALLRHARGRMVRSLATYAAVDRLAGSVRASWDEAVANYHTARTAIDSDAEHDWERATVSLAAISAERRIKLQTLRSRMDDARALLNSASRADTSANTVAPTVDAGVLTLHFARLGAMREIYGFVSVHRAGSYTPITRAYHVGAVAADANAAALGDALLAPAAAELRQATEIRIETDSALSALNVHAALLDGEPLAIRARVGLRRRPPRPKTTSRPRLSACTSRSRSDRRPAGGTHGRRASGSKVSGNTPHSKPCRSCGDCGERSLRLGHFGLISLRRPQQVRRKRIDREHIATCARRCAFAERYSYAAERAAHGCAVRVRSCPRGRRKWRSPN
jgi:tetratricopeptide (TPR) repeat protein